MTILTGTCDACGKLKVIGGPCYIRGQETWSCGPCRGDGEYQLDRETEDLRHEKYTADAKDRQP